MLMSKKQIPDSWASSSLYELCVFIRNGYSLKQNKSGEGYPVSRIETIASGAIDFNRIGFGDIDQAKKEQYRLNTGDILFSHINSLEHIGKTALFESSQELYHGMNLLCIRPQSQLFPKFLTYFLKSGATREYFRSKCKRAINQVSINTKEVGALAVPMPPLGEQKRIVAKIESTQSKIQNIESCVSNAETLIGKYKEALLHKAFRGQLIPQDPNDEPASELLNRIKAEQAESTDSKKKKKADLPPIRPEEIPFDIPSTWEWVRLGSIADLTGGVTVDSKRKPVNPVNLPYLRVANVQRGFLDMSEIKYITVEAAVAGGLALLSGDILFTEGGDLDKLGRGWVWDNELPKAIHQNHVFRARVGMDIRLSKYISRYSNSFGKEYFLKQGKKTTNLASINITKLSLLPIPLPPLRIANTIEDEIQRWWHKCDGLTEVSCAIQNQAIQLKNSVLNSAFSGKLVQHKEVEGTGHELLEQILKAQSGKTEAPSKSKKKTRTKK